MILAVLISIVAVVFLVKLEEPEDVHEWICTGVLGFITFVSVLAVGLLFAALIGTAIPEESTIHEPKPPQTMYAFKNGSSVTGRFFLAYGIIDEEPCYYYIADLGKGMKLQKVKAKHAYVVEENGEPSITEYLSVGFRHPLLWLIAIPGNDYYVIRVPEGTIAQEYEVRLD